MRFSASLIAVAGLALTLGAGPASAESELPGACEVTSLSRVQSTVGLGHSALLRNSNNLDGTGSLEPSEVPSDIHTVCGVGLWSGAKPKTRAAMRAKAKSGQAAQVAILTWAPNNESVNVDKWTNGEFQKTTSEFVKTRFRLVYNFPAQFKPLNPAGDGYSGAGALLKPSGSAKGLVAAVGCWWDPTTQRDLCILDEEAEGKPVVDHLNGLAKTIVPNFLGAP